MAVGRQTVEIARQAVEIARQIMYPRAKVPMLQLSARGRWPVRPLRLIARQIMYPRTKVPVLQLLSAPGR